MTDSLQLYNAAVRPSPRSGSVQQDAPLNVLSVPRAGFGIDVWQGGDYIYYITTRDKP